ncbi:hypothetical protein Hdeb2414_s0016g00489671 [Helianthus debilis subsp. tardiflorus]
MVSGRFIFPDDSCNRWSKLLSGGRLVYTVVSRVYPTDFVVNPAVGAIDWRIHDEDVLAWVSVRVPASGSSRPTTAVMVVPTAAVSEVGVLRLGSVMVCSDQI